MRCLRLVLAALTVTKVVYAGSTSDYEDGCMWHNPKPEHGSVKYTDRTGQVAAMSGIRYDNGTVAELTCPDGRRIIGNKKTQCLNGNWTEVFGYCARGCGGLEDVQRHHSISYTASTDKMGKHLDGTIATLKCNPGPPIGRTESKCVDGEWTSKIGYCGSKCSQQSVKELGYSEMQVNGSRVDGDVNHHTDVELLCGEERHKFRCDNGVFHSKHALRPCGSCSTAMSARPGYTAVNIRGRSVNGEPVEGSFVGLLCRNACAPPENSSTDHSHFTFTTSLRNGAYEPGTEVTLFCDSGPVIGGASKSLCLGGDWYPPLGRCPQMCNPEDLTKMNFKDPKILETEEKGLLYHGGKASATYTANSTSTSYNMTCIDGKWWIRFTI